MNRTSPLSDGFAELIAQRFHALGDPTRLKLLDRLREGEAHVLELATLLETTPQNVSKHLGVLHQLGIVARRKKGNYVYYSVADDSIYALCEIVCGGIERQLEDRRAALAS
jgi:DNA-binding transcriptional ArsR family regulator